MEETLLDIFTGGVDHNLPGNGGQLCVDYSSYRRRILESAFGLTFAFGQIYWAYPRLKFPSQTTPTPTTTVRRFLTAFLCLTFGIEIGFKFSSKTLVYILNPCHVATMLQIGLLLTESSNHSVTYFFRLHIYTLSGALLALVLPVLNTRLLPMEVGLYYIQHIAILSIPVYLMSYGGSFSVEEFWDPAWFVMCSGVLFVYHFFFLHILGVALMVNLNNMVCPAISDPFRGRFYRLAGLAHQALYIPLFGKVYGLVSQSILRLLNAHPGAASPSECNGSLASNGSACLYEKHIKQS